MSDPDYSSMPNTELMKQLKKTTELITQNRSVGEDLSKTKSTISNVLIHRMEEAETDVFENEFGTFTLNTAIKPKILDWDAVHKYVHDNYAYHLLYKQMSSKAYNELLEAGETIPGTDNYTLKSIGVRKPKGKYLK